ncbi:MAG TPA: hypothetical protein VM782_21390 [Stellaceae bacterium]|nr:hypothetical protein [Stellaceae bacterium]
MSACAPVIGYPNDPENTDATVAILVSKYFAGGTIEQAYFNTDASAATARMQLRNEIVLGRMRAYDIEFGDFEKRLYGDGNGVTLGGDLIALVLSGLTATTGNATTKAALGAATAGVVGAKAAIDKDLYYQKTVPALLAQMEADRLKALEPITKGMKLPDADYALMQAYIDLDVYKNAGSIPAAINAVNKDAGEAKEDAQQIIMDARSSAADQLKGIASVEPKLKALTDQQVIALANVMQLNLPGRAPQIQNLVKSLDPKNLRLTAAKRARAILDIWLHEDNLTPANLQQWLDAIAAVSKGS